MDASFCVSEKLYKQNAKEVQKWNDMFRRILAKDIRGINIKN